jgi:hypothetical protein
VNTNLHIYKKIIPSFINNEDQRKEKITGLDIEQIYGHGSQRGPMPGVTCRLLAGSKLLFLLLLDSWSGHD